MNDDELISKFDENIKKITINCAYIAYLHTCLKDDLKREKESRKEKLEYMKRKLDKK